MPKLSKMQVTTGAGTGTRDFVFKTNAALYQSIGATVGILALTDANKSAPVARIEDLTLYGILETISVSVGTTAATRKSISLLCDAELVKQAKSDLIGKSIPQGTITSVSEGLKAEGYI
jgi:hypothetical protein